MILSIDTIRYMFKTMFDSFPPKKPRKTTSHMHWSQKTQATWQIKGCDLVTFTTGGITRKFGERTISYVKMWNRLNWNNYLNASNKWCHIFFTRFETTIFSWNFNVFPPPSSTSSPKGLACNHGSLGCWCCSSRNLKDLGGFARVIRSRMSVAVTWRER